MIVNTNGTMERQAITLGLEPREISHDVLLDFWSRTLRTLEPVPVVSLPQRLPHLMKPAPS